MPEEIYDVVIIGGGPAGLSAAQYAARARLKTVVLDKSSSAGALASASSIENYPGMPEPVSGSELLDIFRKQALKFGAEYLDDTQVIGVNLEGNVKEVFTMNRTYSGKTVILATGSMGRKASISGESEFLGKGVSYCAVCDAAFFRGKTVCVIGGSEEAVKEAGHLTKFAETVYLIVPSKKLKVDDDYPSLNEENLKILIERKVTSIEGSDIVERIIMADPEGNEETIELSGVFVYLQGNKPIVDFLGGMLETSAEDCIVAGRHMDTSVPGVFAAGDVTCTEIRQVVIAAANGCAAALSADRYIFHRKRTRHDWAKGAGKG
jgi:thioredoxin reductase (NADPH)